MTALLVPLAGATLMLALARSVRTIPRPGSWPRVDDAQLLL